MSAFWLGVIVGMLATSLVNAGYFYFVQRDYRHLCNAYRAELGEPPLFPRLHCHCCNPPASVGDTGKGEGQ